MATWVRIDLKKCFFGPLWSWLIRVLASYVTFTGFGEAVRLGGGGGWWVVVVFAEVKDQQGLINVILK